MADELAPRACGVTRGSSNENLDDREAKKLKSQPMSPARQPLVTADKVHNAKAEANDLMVEATTTVRSHREPHGLR